MTHHQTHEDWLASHLAGEALGAEEMQAMESCPICRAERKELGDLQTRLASEGRQQRDRILTQLERFAGAPGEEATLEQLEGLMPLARARWSSRLVGVALVAALAASVLLWLRSPQAPVIGTGETPTGGGGTDYLLGSTGDFELLAPLGPVESYADFTWEAEAEFGETYLLILRDGSLGASSEPLLQKPLRSPRWTPDIDLPPDVLWTVLVKDRGGRVRAAAGMARAYLE